MKRMKHIGAVVLVTGLIACGNANKAGVGPDPVEVVEAAEGSNDGSVKIEAITGADPDAMKEADFGNETDDTKPVVNAIEWLDFETAIDRNKEKRKFIFIDIYTDWCGWCKKMDASTFKSPSVINYIHENFYAVKMDAESKEAIAYREVLYESKAYGKKMYNELAVNLLAGKMSFPSFVVLNKREVKRGVINGYQQPSALLSILKKYIGS